MSFMIKFGDDLQITESERSTPSVRRSTRKRAGATDEDEKKAKIAKKVN